MSQASAVPAPSQASAGPAKASEAGSAGPAVEANLTALKDEAGAEPVVSRCEELGDE